MKSLEKKVYSNASIVLCTYRSTASMIQFRTHFFLAQWRYLFSLQILNFNFQLKWTDFIKGSKIILFWYFLVCNGSDQWDYGNIVKTISHWIWWKPSICQPIGIIWFASFRMACWGMLLQWLRWRKNPFCQWRDIQWNFDLNQHNLVSHWWIIKSLSRFWYSFFKVNKEEKIVLIFLPQNSPNRIE